MQLIQVRQKKNSVEIAQKFVGESNDKINSKNTVLKRSSHNISHFQKSIESTGSQDEKTTKAILNNLLNDKAVITQSTDAINTNHSKSLARKLPEKLVIESKYKRNTGNAILKRSSNNTFPFLPKPNRNTDFQDIKTTITAPDCHDKTFNKTVIKQRINTIYPDRPNKLALKLPTKFAAENKFKRNPDNDILKRNPDNDILKRNPDNDILKRMSNNFQFSTKTAKSTDSQDVKNNKVFPNCVDKMFSKIEKKQVSDAIRPNQSKKLPLKLPKKCAAENKLKKNPENVVLNRMCNNFQLSAKSTESIDSQSVKKKQPFPNCLDKTFNKTGTKQDTGAISTNQSKTLALKLPKCVDKTFKKIETNQLNVSICPNQSKKLTLKSPRKLAVETNYKRIPENTGLRKPNTVLKTTQFLGKSTVCTNFQNVRRSSVAPSSKIEDVAGCLSKSDENIKKGIGIKTMDQDAAETNSKNAESPSRKTTNIKSYLKSPHKETANVQKAQNAKFNVQNSLNNKENYEIGKRAIPKRNFISKLKKPL